MKRYLYAKIFLSLYETKLNKTFLQQIESKDEHVQITEESEGLQDVPGLHLDHWGVINVIVLHYK